jgi:hypothetical protein
MYNYVIAMVRGTADKRVPHLKLLYTGVGYTKEQAELRAAELNKTCEGELKSLGYSVFVAYNPCSE